MDCILGIEKDIVKSKMNISLICVSQKDQITDEMKWKMMEKRNREGFFVKRVLQLLYIWL